MGRCTQVQFAALQEENILEYTDAPSTETNVLAAGTMPCPLCGQTLTADAASCTHCDWKRESKETAEGQASDAVAVLLSLLPGLGHIYKGHRLLGLLLMFVGTPMAMGGALLLATGTAGFGILILPVYWLGVMVHVYAVQDRIQPAGNDEGEEY
ncbi:MAG: hypothetical protein ABIR71_09905 [Chthoniobacterales bacterium]